MYLCIRVRFTAMPNANGRLPEWLGIGLQNRGQQFESATDLQECRTIAALLVFSNQQSVISGQSNGTRQDHRRHHIG